MNNEIREEPQDIIVPPSANESPSTQRIDDFRRCLVDGNADLIEAAFVDYSSGENPDFLTMLTCALLTKESVVHRDTSIDFLHRTMVLFPNEPAVYYELAVALGDDYPEWRMGMLRHAVSIAPDFDNARKVLAAAYLMAGRLSHLTDAHTSGSTQAARISRDWVESALNYMRSIAPAAPSHDLVSGVIASATSRPMTTLEDVAAVLISTARQHKPFALVRLGDGEGAIARFSDEEELRNLSLYNANRDYFSHRWFGQPYDATGSALGRLQADLHAGLHEADIIGYPDEDWMRHELRIGNVQTFSCCVNAARLGSACAAQGSALATRTSIHFDLLGCGALAELLGIRRKVALISSHGRLPAYLAARFPGLEVAHSFNLPPAYSDLPITGYSIAHRAYDVAPAVVESFDPVDRQALVLVGAGFVGKSISLKLKAMGFMVIDVGSIFDHMMGFSTRPNFSLYDLDKCFRGRAHD